MHSKFYKKISALLLTGCFVLFITGCQSLGGYPERIIPIDGESGELLPLKKYFTEDVVGTYNSKTGSAQQAYRNEIVHGRLRAIDLQFEAFEKELQQENNSQKIALDFAVLGMSGAGTIAGGAATKAILAAISGGLTGAGLSIDKSLYYEKTMPILFAQMEAMRATQLANIYTGLKLDTAQYPLSRALFDVDTYYKVGTLSGAMVGINTAAGATHDAANKKIEKILEGSYMKDCSSDRLRTFWKPDGKTVDLANAEKLKTWLQNNGFESDDVTALIRLDTNAAARVKAVQDLGLGNC
jgi:hypothetical protein